MNDKHALQILENKSYMNTLYFAYVLQPQLHCNQFDRKLGISIQSL